MKIKNEKSLKQKILEEMTASYSNALERNFESAKKFIRITPEGKIDILLKDKLTGIERILLYLIGKLYAKEAGKVTDIDVGNEEMANELGIPIGSLLPWLKNLRDLNKIKSIKRGRYTHHQVQINLIEKILNDIEKKIGKKTG